MKNFRSLRAILGDDDQLNLVRDRVSSSLLLQKRLSEETSKIGSEKILVQHINDRLIELNVTDGLTASLIKQRLPTITQLLKDALKSKENIKILVRVSPTPGAEITSSKKQIPDSALRELETLTGSLAHSELTASINNLVMNHSKSGQKDQK
ncbi:MAG: hypothetical protein ACO3FP_07045 [Burkholderiales bacterium]